MFVGDSEVTKTSVMNTLIFIQNITKKASAGRMFRVTTPKHLQVFRVPGGSHPASFNSPKHIHIAPRGLGNAIPNLNDGWCRNCMWKQTQYEIIKMYVMETPMRE